MAVDLTLTAAITAVETLPGNAPYASASNKRVTHTLKNVSSVLGASTTPPVTKYAGFLQALSTGTATIDLTSLTGTNGAAVTGLGLKLQAAKFTATSTNTGTITLVEGASNGYEMLGNAFSIILQPGQWFMFYGNDAAPDVAAGAKTIDLSGTGSESVDCELVFG